MALQKAVFLKPRKYKKLNWNYTDRRLAMVRLQMNIPVRTLQVGLQMAIVLHQMNIPVRTLRVGLQMATVLHPMKIQVHAHRAGLRKIDIFRMG